jgi:hypothetical protein
MDSPIGCYYAATITLTGGSHCHLMAKLRPRLILVNLACSYISRCKSSQESSPSFAWHFKFYPHPGEMMIGECISKKPISEILKQFNTSHEILSVRRGPWNIWGIGNLQPGASHAHHMAPITFSYLAAPFQFAYTTLRLLKNASNDSLNPVLVF